MKKGFIVILLALFIYSCESHYTPRPRGYFRIDLPEKSYQKFDTTYPYTFEYPVYATVEPSPDAGPEDKYWINIQFRRFKATLHISYKQVNNNLITYLEDAHTLAIKHIPKADAIYDSLIVDRDRNVFGLVYQIEGTEVASPYQFFLTDSTSNFVRGALYFNVVPNNDSLEPVINYLEKDLDHFINTFRWK
jgi:gliding motility-associated lipoprotein GldD